MKEYKNKPGYCPKCNSTNLRYEPVYFNGDNCIFDYECKECGLVGEEYYYIEFIGHKFYDEDKKEYIELEV